MHYDHVAGQAYAKRDATFHLLCLPLPLCSQAGAVELESAELRFNTDAAGQPTTVTVKQVRLV